MAGPVTLVTGASRGIGRYLAEHYLDEGHRVVGCSRGESDLSHDRYVHHQVDVRDEGQVKSLFASVRRDLEGLDHVLNNAGIASMNHSLLTPVSTVEKIFATNATASFLFSREAAKIMKRSRFGRIVNFTTVAVRMNLEGEAAYVASKAAVEAFTKVMARELAEFGITVNAVGPTPVETDLIRNVPKEKIESLLRRQAISRFGTFEDVANVVDFFLSRESDFVTGQLIYLGGV
jgi:3-oxoacyl-[acyl-carrier protein] reductase